MKREQAVQRIDKQWERERVTPWLSAQMSTLQELIEFRVRSVGTPMTPDKAINLMSIVRSDINTVYERIHKASSMGVAVVAGSTRVPIVSKQPISVWWGAQANALADRFDQQIRLSMLANETIDQLIERLKYGGDNRTSASAG